MVDCAIEYYYQIPELCSIFAYEWCLIKLLIQVGDPYPFINYYQEIY